MADDIYLEFIEIITEIQDDLSDDQFKRMLVYMGDRIPKAKRQEILDKKDFLEVYEILKERDVIRPASEQSSGDSSYFIKILQKIKRDDLANKLKSFHDSFPDNLKIICSSSSFNSLKSMNSSSSFNSTESAASYIVVNDEKPNSLVTQFSESFSIASQNSNSSSSSKRIDLYLDDQFENDGPKEEEDCAEKTEKTEMNKPDENSLSAKMEELKKRLFEPNVVKSTIIQDFSECSDFDPNNYSNESTYLSDEQIKALQLGIQPRKYQIELANLSLHGHNSIICLRTGGGKTLVAALVVKYLHVLNKYKLQKRFKSIFIVPTRLLIEQQLGFFRRVFGPDLSNFDLKGLEDDELLEDYIVPVDIIFCTPQKLVNCLKNSTINFNLTSIDLIVFDECHHGIKNHPYNDIMRYYHKQRMNFLTNDLKLPKIIGLTASIGCGDAKKAFDQLVYLCANLDCVHLAFIQANEKELTESAPSAHAYRVHSFDKPRSDKFALAIEEIMKMIEDLTNLKPLRPYGSMLYMQRLIEMNRDMKKLGDRNRTIAGEFLLLFNSELLNYNDLAFEQVYKSLDERMKEKRIKNPIDIEQFIYEIYDETISNVFSSPFNELLEKELVNDYNQKLKTLISIILDHLEKDKSAMGLVFVPTRNNAVAIQAFIESQISKELLKSYFLMGKAKNPNQILDENISDTQQKIILEKFKKREYNLLVVTSVAAEGVDIPDCNYVIRFDFVSDEIGFIQIRGRARCEDSYYHVITYQNSLLLKNEKKNEILEREMELALKTRLNIGSEEFERMVEDRKTSIYNEISNESEIVDVEKDLDSKLYEIFCSKCNELLCDSKSLRKRAQNYITVDETFITNKVICGETIVKEFKTEKYVAKVLCKNHTCGNELGHKLEYTVGELKIGYTLTIKSIKFREKNACSETNYILFKKWKDVNFDIKEIPL